MAALGAAIHASLIADIESAPLPQPLLRKPAETPLIVS